MAKRKTNGTICEGAPGRTDGCRVESIISMDERGQLVLPKDLRSRASIRPGDRLALTSWEKDGEVCCITLTKVDGLAEMVKEKLGPVMKALLQGSK